MKIIAGIPAYNEEKFIGKVIKETKKYVDKVLVVDDGSTDKTAQIAKNNGAIVIRHKKNKGKGIAVNKIFDKSREIKVDILVLLDGDGQHQPEEIPSLIKPIIYNEADIVIGSRFIKNKNFIPLYRKIGLYVLTLVTNFGSKIKVTDSQSGFRAFSKKAINNLNFKEKGLAVESEMQFLAKEKKLRILEIPINTTYEERAKRNPFFHGFNNLIRIFIMILKRNLKFEV